MMPATTQLWIAKVILYRGAPGSPTCVFRARLMRDVLRPRTGRHHDIHRIPVHVRVSCGNVFWNVTVFVIQVASPGLRERHGVDFIPGSHSFTSPTIRDGCPRLNAACCKSEWLKMWGRRTKTLPRQRACLILEADMVFQTAYCVVGSFLFDATLVYDRLFSTVFSMASSSLSVT